MFALVIVAILLVPLVLLRLILSLRKRGSGDEDSAAPHDGAPINPVALREYTVTGSIDFVNPPPGYTAPDIPRD